MIIEDLLFAVANIGFVLADGKQAHKLFTKNYDTKSFSKTHYRLKLFALTLVSIAYAMLGTHLALAVALAQIILNIYIFWKIGGMKNEKILSRTSIQV